MMYINLLSFFVSFNLGRGEIVHFLWSRHEVLVEHTKARKSVSVCYLTKQATLSVREPLLFKTRSEFLKVVFCLFFKLILSTMLAFSINSGGWLNRTEGAKPHHILNPPAATVNKCEKCGVSALSRHFSKKCDQYAVA